MTRERLPERRGGEAFEFDHGGFHYTAAAGFYDDGRLGEVFLSASVKSGTPIEAAATCSPRCRLPEAKPDAL